MTVTNRVYTSSSSSSPAADNGPQGTRDALNLRKSNGDEVAFPKRNLQLFHYLVSIFIQRLDPQQAEQFRALAAELERSVADNCRQCVTFCDSPVGVVRAVVKDPRRQRFLLRLVVAHIANLFVGDNAPFPRSLVEGIDRYMKKSMGDIIYGDLNIEAEDLLIKLNTDDDKELWDKIQNTPEWRRFADNIFIRIMLRFENYERAKKTFIQVMDSTMKEKSNFHFVDGHFLIVFKAMFADIWKGLGNEEQRLRWDYMFGDGTSKKLALIFDRLNIDTNANRGAKKGLPF
ncbi:MAG: hypothetical protein K2Q10_08265 [Rhodospirillales bacterium]|nr:hypothetical protein [Rhodospirillales bacterium]